jgi:uncharacterized protein (DUF4415 family)
MASKRRTVRYTLGNLPEGDTDWERVDRLTDEEIEQAIREDPDAAPIADQEWFRKAVLVIPPHLKHRWVQIDEDLMAWFRGQGEDWPARINEVLRTHLLQRGKTKRRAG